ncbi:MAG: GNAT family N-acetyltransferase [Chloroflexi bacterium]|nr:GNAT family N-acetyltransferase [Chloroflexota bacterium]MCC6894904.1 GNAT family N-acetyltransferase [Anaerolineae bacterium]
MHPVAPSHPALPDLFDTPYLHFVVTAMGTGNSPALVWADDLHAPTAAFIWDTTHSVYFGGRTDNDTFNIELRHFLAATFLPDVAKRQLGLLKLYTANDAWRSLAPSFFEGMGFEDRMRVLYRLPAAPVFTPAPPLPPHLHLRLIDDDLLGQRSLRSIDPLLEEIQSCWTLLERFLDQGFGYCIVSDTDGILAWCTAEYVSPGVCGVGIETLEAYQGNGLATAIAQAFAQHALSLGWQVHWDAWLTNTPSTRVAEKAGFQKVTEYPITLAIFK